MNPDILRFTDVDHSYWMGDVRYESVSHVFKQYVRPFNSMYHSLRMSLRDLHPGVYRALDKCSSDEEFERILVPAALKYKDVIEAADALRAGWSAEALQSTTEGTAIHTYLEDRSIERGYEINPFNGQKMVMRPSLIEGADNRAYCADLIDIPDGYYPEIVAFNRWARVGGQSDKGYVWTDLDGTRNVFLDDWKTDKPEKMNRDAFWHPYYGRSYYKPPIDHLEDANINAYEVKISIYAWMFEQAGFRVRGMRLTHIIKDCGKVTIIPLTYRRAEISSLMEDYVQRKNQREEKAARSRVRRKP